MTGMQDFTLYPAPGFCSLAAHIVAREVNARFDLVRVSLATHFLAGVAAQGMLLVSHAGLT